MPPQRRTGRSPAAPTAPTSPPRARPVRPAVRAAAALTAAAAGAALVAREAGFRGWEAFTAGHVTALVTAAPAYTNRSTFFVDVGSRGVFGLRVTAECTSALILIGLLGITALLAAITRLPLSRLAAALLVGSAAFYLINQARLVGIALASRQWGLGAGYHWSHVWAGTVVTVFGAAAVAAAYLAVIGAVGRHHTPSHRPAA